VVAVTFDGSELYVGLAALHWHALDFTEPGPDFEAFRDAIARGDGPALEVGCGTGRLLLPLLAAGLDVDGVDISASMLTVARHRIDTRGLQTTLHCQAMQHLDLPRRYATIVIPCGTFVLIVDKRDALEVLRRLRRHLRPGGRLVFNLFLPWHDLPAYPLPDVPAWEPRGDHRVVHADGDRLVIERRVTRLDPAAEVLVDQRRYRLYDGTRIVAEEVRRGAETWYGPFEIRLMLEAAGFADVTITGDYTGAPLAHHHRQVMFIDAGW
jgi:SAM-dependent methyltransferase